MCMIDKALLKLMKSCNVPRKHLQCISIVLIGAGCLLMYTCSLYLGFFKTEERYTTILLSEVMVPSFSTSPLDTQGASTLQMAAAENSTVVTSVNSQGEIPAELNSNSKTSDGFKPTFISTNISVNNDQVQRLLKHRNSTQTHQESNFTSNANLPKKDPEANRVGPLHSFYPGGFVDPGERAAQQCRGARVQLQLQLQLVVFSAPGHWAQREAIRRAWAAPLAALGGAALAFLVGRAPETRHEGALAREQLAHGDLIRPNFIDDYRNLSLKTVSMLQWFSEYCNASYLLKIDDDVAFSAQKLETVLKKHANLKNAIIGQVVRSNKPIRSVANKYYVSFLQWPKNASFPPFTSGPSYLMTGNAVPMLYRRALQTDSPIPFLPLEDVLLTGVIAPAAAIQLKSEPRWISEEGRTNSCLRQILAPEMRSRLRGRPSCILHGHQHVVYHSVPYRHMPILMEALG